MGCQTDKDVREPSPIHATSETPTNCKSYGSVKNISPPNSATMSFHNLKKENSNSRQSTLDDCPIARLKTDYQINNGDSCPVLYSVDLPAKKVVSFNLDTQSWTSNILPKSALYNSNPLFIPLKPLEELVLDHLEDATPVFVSDRIVHFIGPKHFSLDTKENLFSYRQNRDCEIKHPTLCRIGDYIYALSGIEGDEYTTKCERYDIVKNTWTSMAPLDRPYYRGSASGFIDSHGNHKLIIIGGLYTKSSMKSNQTMSVYDIANNRWAESQIKYPLQTDLAAPSYPLFPYDDNNLSIIAPKEDKLHQSLININTGKITIHRELTTKEKLSDIIVESFCIHKGQLSLVLSEKVHQSSNEVKSKNCVMISVKV